MPASVRRKVTTTAPDASLTDIKPEVDMEDQSPINEASSSRDTPATHAYTSLRRSTRSSTGTGTALNPTIPINPSANGLDLSRYAYNPITPPRKRVKLEHSDIDTKVRVQTPIRVKDENDISGRGRLPTPRSSSKKLPQLALDKPHKEPERWREQYRLIERMRRGIVAPVDDM